MIPVAGGSPVLSISEFKVDAIVLDLVMSARLSLDPGIDSTRWNNCGR